MSDRDKKIPLVEMFGPTIQGEGAVIGQQTYFMRFGLCDYKCTMCDSMNAVNPQQVKANAQWLTQDEIIQKFLEFHKPDSTRWITLSGGNPCIHDLSAVVHGLQANGFRFAVETQGTKAPSWLSMVNIITVSPKGPGMGENIDLAECDAFVRYTMSANPEAVNFKIVLFDQRDLEFAKLIYERYGHTGAPFYLSLGNPYPPGFHNNLPGNHEEHMRALVEQYKILFEDIQTDLILSNMRFLPQWHVFVWGNEKGK